MTDILKESLLTASYAGVEFPVVSEEGELGHDYAPHKAYRRRGADLEPTGFREEKGQLNAIFFNDIQPDLFPTRYEQFIEALKNNPIAEFHHPIAGIMQAGIHVVKRSTDFNKRNGVSLVIEWIEHNASASDVVNAQSQTPHDTQNSIEAQATTADTAMATADLTSSFTPTKPVITTELDKLGALEDKASYSQVTSSVKKMTDVVDGNLSLDVFSNADSHDARVALEQLKVSLYQLRDQLLPDASRMIDFVVDTPLALWQISQLVYGDATHGSDILAVNKIADPLNIRPGTKLKIPSI